MSNQAKRPGFSNPALRAMGIRSLRLPSRNWMIFWSVLAVSLSGAIYDKQEQKKVIKKYVGLVEPMSHSKISQYSLPRKMTVFIAPPPSDYLETTLKVWRRYVKPVLFYAGLDYEIVEEHKQGVIRADVANRIRELRKQVSQTQPETEDVKSQPIIIDEEVFDAEAAKNFKLNFDYRDAMGIFKNSTSKPVIVKEDALVEDPQFTGGVICLGRGAYKEYIRGLHEGLLGPLDPPSKESVPHKDDNNNPEDSEKDDEKENVVEPPYIDQKDYSSLPWPEELTRLADSNGIIRNPKDNVPILLHQPILVIPIPNLIGFLAIPERIRRFYQKQVYAESVCSATCNAVLLQNVRKFDRTKDLTMAKDEEKDWPSNWVKQGKERNSEWVQELTDDPRVSEYLYVYDADEKPDNSRKY